MSMILWMTLFHFIRGFIVYCHAIQVLIFWIWFIWLCIFFICCGACLHLPSFRYWKVEQNIWI